MFSQKEKSVIYEAFDMYYINYCKTIPSNEELSYITFTKDFEEKMQKLIESERKFYFYWVNTVRKRVAIIILAIIISLTSVTFGVKAIREPVIRFIIETFEKFANIIFVNEEPETLTDDFIFEKETLSYIPEGFVLETEIDNGTIYQVLYTNTEVNSTLMYMQQINDNSTMQVNTENVTYENMTINGNQAIFYSNLGTQTIVFSNNKYVYTIATTESKEELIKIAESIDIK